MRRRGRAATNFETKMGRCTAPRARFVSRTARLSRAASPSGGGGLPSPRPRPEPAVRDDDARRSGATSGSWVLASPRVVALVLAYFAPPPWSFGSSSSSCFYTTRPGSCCAPRVVCVGWGKRTHRHPNQSRGRPPRLRSKPESRTSRVRRINRYIDTKYTGSQKRHCCCTACCVVIEAKAARARHHLCEERAETSSTAAAVTGVEFLPSPSQEVQDARADDCN